MLISGLIRGVFFEVSAKASCAQTATLKMSLNIVAAQNYNMTGEEVERRSSRQG
jgi:hypothetical protein